MLMTLPLDDPSFSSPPAGSSRDSAPAFDETHRRVEEAVANRIREKGIKDELRRALYRQAIDGGLQRFNGTSQPSRLRMAGRVVICGFAAFLVVIWALGPTTLDVIEALLVAAAASVTLGTVSLAVAALCDRLAGKPSDPADHHPRRKGEKALRRLF